MTYAFSSCIHSGAVFQELALIRKSTFLFLPLLLLLATFVLSQDNPPTPQATPSSDQETAAAQEKSSSTAKPGQKKEGDEDLPAARKAKRSEPALPEPATPAETKPEEKKPADPLTSADTYKGLHLRGIGPAVISGRITSLAVNPFRRAQYFVGAASGGVWKTDNDGQSWS